MSFVIGAALFAVYFGFIAAVGLLVNAFPHDLQLPVFAILAVSGAFVILWVQRNIEMLFLRRHVRRNPNSAWSSVVTQKRQIDDTTHSSFGKRP